MNAGRTTGIVYTKTMAIHMTSGVLVRAEAGAGLEGHFVGTSRFNSSNQLSTTRISP